MKIESRFLTGVISKVIRKTLRKKFGYDVNISLNNVKVTVNDGNANIHIDADAELEKSEIVKILMGAGLD